MTEKELCGKMYRSIAGALSELEKGNEFDARIILILAHQLAEKEMRELQIPPFSSVKADAEAAPEQPGTKSVKLGK